MTPLMRPSALFAVPSLPGLRGNGALLVSGNVDGFGVIAFSVFVGFSF
jgi:hypothetical protein